MKERNSLANAGRMPSRLAVERATEARKNVTAWSKGLCKENDVRIARAAELIRGTMLAAYAAGTRSVSDEQKLALSRLAKQTKFGGYTPRGGRGKKGWYQGVWCDSSWELAWVVYARDVGIEFTRNTQKFGYEYQGKAKSYIPDFILSTGEYLEIKGYEGKQFQAKLASFPHKIIVLNEELMKPIIAHAIMKFGKDFTKIYESGEVPRAV